MYCIGNFLNMIFVIQSIYFNVFYLKFNFRHKFGSVKKHAMKKKFILISILLICWIFSYSQNCIPVAIVFTTQAQVDSFPKNYPGCNVIDGNVGITGDNITNLDSLIQIKEIKGSVQMLDLPNLNNFKGLDSLNGINGQFTIKNSGISNMIGLNSLDSIKGDFKIEYSQIINFNGLSNLEYIHGDFVLDELSLLSSFSGLESLTSISGNLYLEVHNANLLNFNGLSSIISIGKDLKIFALYPHNGFSLTGITNLTSIGRSIILSGNIYNFNLFSNLTIIDGSLEVTNNKLLSNMSDFNSLVSINGTLKIQYNQGLTEISGFQSLTSVNYLIIEFNNFLSNINGLNHNIAFNDGIFISENPFLSSCSIESICNKILINSSQVQIGFNGPNCNSVAIVQQNCGLSTDFDGDGILNTTDDCPNTPNPNQADCNNNGIGDKCDTASDSDNDGINDNLDNCPCILNADQLDADNDGLGNVCDNSTDADNDGIIDTNDNCPAIYNPSQTDQNNNGIGDACEVFPKVGINTNSPKTELHLSNGTLYVDNPEKGIILKNHQGQCFIIKMNGNLLQVTPVNCP